MQRLKASYFRVVVLLFLTVTLMTDSSALAQVSSWHQTVHEAETRGLTWIRVNANNGEVVNWSTSLAGLVLLGQRSAVDPLRPLGYARVSADDQALLNAMAKYVVDVLLRAEPAISDTRAYSYALSFLTQFRLTGGPNSIDASQTVDAASDALVTILLDRQLIGELVTDCAQGSWALPGGNTSEMWHTQIAVSALIGALRNPNIANRHNEINTALASVKTLLERIQGDDGGWSVQPCSTEVSSALITAALLHITQALSGTSATVIQRRALGFLDRQFQLQPADSGDPRFYQLLWSTLRMYSSLPSDLIVPPFFTWTPQYDPIAAGHPTVSASLSYDIHRTLLVRQSPDGTFACEASMDQNCERPVHSTLFGLLTLQTNLIGACIDSETDADTVCADVDLCPNVHDPEQLDTDGDYVGDLCDLCPETINPEQNDNDGDGIGDLCDPLDCVALEAELCNGLDDDCDEIADEDIESNGSSCAANSGGACAVGKRYCVDGVDVCIPNLTPVREECDGLDNDCDNQVDENSSTWLESCITGRPGVCSLGFTACRNGEIECLSLTDASSERCDGQDNDCDGLIDEGNPGGNIPCSTGDLGLCSEGRTQCLSGQSICVRQIDAASELCDGLDNDCDGLSDEGEPESGDVCTLEGQSGLCAQGVTACRTGLKTCLVVLEPGSRAEICNGLDDDCNGEVDDNVQSPDPLTVPEVDDVCQTQCGTGLIECALGALRCNGPELGFPEFCDGLDNDCDGVIDEDSPGGGISCLTGDSGLCAAGLTVCSNGNIECLHERLPEDQATASETCNGIDDDCDGTVDENTVGSGLSCTTQRLGSCARGTNRCINGSLTCVSIEEPRSETCDGIDNNCNGFVDESLLAVGTECDTGRVGVCQFGQIACQLSDATDSFGLICVANTEATAESCDGVDNDCDNTIDENAVPQDTLCDTGLQGACRLGELSCLAGQTNCRQTALPETEICDGSDNDCDGTVDESDTRIGLNCTSTLAGTCAAGIQRCVAGEMMCQSSARPTLELCDGFDNDCDGDTDEGNPGAGAVCPLFDRIGQCSVGRTSCISGQLTCSVLQEPEVERCDGQDNDCDGEIDEGNPDSGAVCSTGRFGLCDVGQRVCLNGGLICEGVNPPADELCDGLDNDCDNIVDEDTSNMDLACDTGEVGVCAAGVRVCMTGLFACQPVNQPAGETCNATDDDCDGRIDEGLLNACGRCGLVPPETCDTKDNDCDGRIDEGSLCGDELTCALGICTDPCTANECPDPNDTCVNDGCVPRCLAAQCPPGSGCTDGVCEDPCPSITCEDGEVCAQGRCVGDSCYLAGCGEGERCVQGSCVPDNCAELECPNTHFCRQIDGQAACVESCALISCGFHEMCADGMCRANPCADVTCPESIDCIDGRCDTDCAGIICPQGQRCRGGQCGHDPCFGIVCPNGQRCEAISDQAQCVADWLRQLDEDLVDSGMTTDPTDMGITSPDSDFVPPTYDQGNPPPSFVWDAGTTAPTETSNDTGCGCSQNQNPPMPIGILLLGLLCRKRKRRSVGA